MNLFCFLTHFFFLVGQVGDKSHSFSVEKMDHISALHFYEPHIVISSWMSRQSDWTFDIRACQSVIEYILIGEVDYGASVKINLSIYKCFITIFLSFFLFFCFSSIIF